MISSSVAARPLWHRFELVFLLIAVAGYVLIFAIYVQSEKGASAARESRRTCLLLVDELRQTSEDLTRMARLYVITGEPKYRQYYTDILETRAGQRARPEPYSPIYWNLVLAGQRPAGLGPAVPFLDLARRAGFTPEELDQLAAAKEASDRLTTPERAAMALVDNQTDDSLRQQALSRLTDSDYLNAKSQIMQALGGVVMSVTTRAHQQVVNRETLAERLRWTFLVIGILNIALLLTMLRGLSRSVRAYARDNVQLTNQQQRSEDALRSSEAKFRALVEARADVIYQMSPDWTEMWQLVGRDFIADTTAPTQTWLEKYIPPDEQPRVMAAIQAAIRGKRLFELEHRIWRADGSVGWTISRAVPILDAQEEITSWFG